MSCFYSSFYFLRVLAVVVPAATASYALRGALHCGLLAPWLLNLTYLSPMAAKYECLLMNVLYRDDELIAQVPPPHCRPCEPEGGRGRALPPPPPPPGG
jgi:hypothetical protein